MDQCTDLFTQQMLKRTEQRSKALGISNEAKYPLAEFTQKARATTITRDNQQASPPGTPRKRSTGAVSKSDSLSSKSPNKHQVHRVITGETKENCDLAFEINITTGANVQVQVEVEEREIDGDGHILHQRPSDTVATKLNDVPMIRDSSRNRLQRLGALYSETENLSSPINRNESRFLLEDDTDTQSSSMSTTRQITRTGKLTALANSIKTWEDDLSHPDAKQHQQRMKEPTQFAPASAEAKVVNCSPKKTGTIPKVRREVPPAKTTAKIAEPKKSKELQWDQNVMDALEQQGFTRRESTTAKLTYDYKKESEPPKPVSTTVTKTISSNLTTALPKAVPESSPDLAIFENQLSALARPLKDPPMSMKEILAMFERNKGAVAPNISNASLLKQFDTAVKSKLKELNATGTRAASSRYEQPSTKIDVVPNTSYLVASSSKQTSPAVKRNLKEYNATVTTAASSRYEQPSKKIDSYNKAVMAESKASGNCIKKTVAALMSKGATMSSAEISQELRKQREREMNVVLNRFHKPDSCDSPEPERPTAMAYEKARLLGATAASTPPTPPVPPPMPATNYNTNSNASSSTGHVEATCIIKRKSGEKESSEDSNQGRRNSQPLFDETKRQKVSNTQTAGRLYPSLSDIESITASESDQDNCTTAPVSSNNDQHYKRYQANDSYELDEDSYMESDDGNSSSDLNDISLGREIMQAVKRNDLERPATRQKRNVVFDSSTSDISTSDAVYEMDDYLNEALEDENDEEITPKKGSVSSDSFSYARTPGKNVRQQTIAEDDETQYEHKPINYSSPVKSALKINPSEDNNMVTLTHTVSFYRRQQSVNNTPVRKVHHTDKWQAPSSADHQHDSADDVDDEDSSSVISNDYSLVKDKVKKLHEEIRMQEQIMSQTSQALNLCAITVEFSGSTEAVEGERHLLVASHRRQAALNEVQRLYVERCLRPIGSPADLGKLIVREITVPLTQQYKDMLNMETICGHHLVCLLKYNETVVATKTVPTLPGLLTVKFPDVLQLNNVYADFKVTLEIYGMAAKRETLQHEQKYHINRKTPKGSKKDENRLKMPIQSSPGGPGAVRTPALCHYGFVIFSLREIQRNNWTLNQVSGVSPLQGTVYMQVNCELNVIIDYKGFLTMFEDVAGFGAWHRRWCHLRGHVLSYWRYPDDEKKKAPMGSINLKTCCTQKVAVAPREVCARLNTLLLEMKRPVLETDRDSLVVVRHSKYTLVRHLFSADTKEERNKWSANFNKALVLVRSWDASRDNTASSV